MVAIVSIVPRLSTKRLVLFAVYNYKYYKLGIDT